MNEVSVKQYSDVVLLNYCTTAIMKISSKSLLLMLHYCNELCTRDYDIDHVYKVLCNARVASNPYNAIIDVLRGMSRSKKQLYKQIVRYLL